MCDVHHSYYSLSNMARLPGLLLWNQFLRDMRDSLEFLVLEKTLIWEVGVDCPICMCQ